MIKYILKEYTEIDLEFRKDSEIKKIYEECATDAKDAGITIEDIEYYDFTDTDIDNLCKNKYIIHQICRESCSQLIAIDESKKTITGIDLFMGFNIKNKSGFSGTINIPKIYDIESTANVDIMEDEESKNTITSVLKKCEIIEYDKDLENILEYIKHIIFNNDIKVIIDVSGLFVGVNALDIYNIIIEKIAAGNSEFRQFIYWDGDTAMTKDKDGKTSVWNKQESENTYYYYDHRHTTGTDAKIVDGVYGAAFLSNTSRYRDVVQGIYRMRKLALPENRRHKIKFIIDKKLLSYIKEILNLEGDINIEKLIEWFKIEEMNVFNKQRVLSTSQNIKAIRRFTQYKKSSPFDANNNYILPNKIDSKKEIILGIKTIENVDLKEKIIKITEMNKYKNDESNKSNIKKLLVNYCKDNGFISEFNAKSTTLTQTQTQTQTLKLNITTNVEVERPIDSKPPPPPDIITVSFNISDYFNKDFQGYKLEKEEDLFYESINLNKFKIRYPAHVIYCDNEYFVIPSFEGFRLINYIKHKPDIQELRDKKYCIIDNEGTKYIDKLDEGEINKVISFTKIIMYKYDDHIKLTANDFRTFILYLHEIKKENNNKFEKIKSIILNYKVKIIKNESSNFKIEEKSAYPIMFINVFNEYILDEDLNNSKKLEIAIKCKKNSFIKSLFDRKKPENTGELC